MVEKKREKQYYLLVSRRATEGYIFSFYLCRLLALHGHESNLNHHIRNNRIITSFTIYRNVNDL